MKRFAHSEDVKIPSLERIIGRFISWSEPDYSDGHEEYPPFISYSGVIQSANDTHIAIKYKDGSIWRHLNDRLLHGFIDQDDINATISANHFAQKRKADLARRESDNGEYDIYALVDPRDQSIRYIGMSYNADHRYRQHINCNGNNLRKNAWIQELETQNLRPVLFLLEVVQGKLQTLEREQHWIEYYGHNNDLLNFNLNTANIDGGTRIDDPVFDAYVREAIAREMQA